jgi:trimeric autotransporter adhesin
VVRNGGAQAAPPAVVRFYLSTNLTLDAGDTVLDAERAVPALAPDATNSGSVSVPLPSGIAGTFFLLAVADRAQQAAETSEQNNVGVRAIQISGVN